VSDDAVVRMRRTIPAPRDRVFRAWTDPEELKRWWGPGLFTTPAAEVDLRPGGDYRLVMETPDGEGLVLAGTFREVVPPERLVYTWRWEIGVPDVQESLVTVEFSEVDGATEIALTHEHAPGSVLDPYQRGWESGLDKLASVVVAG
jgi:uncharacterized protein YndB with AHSA1/START domain